MQNRVDGWKLHSSGYTLLNKMKKSCEENNGQDMLLVVHGRTSMEAAGSSRRPRPRDNIPGRCWMMIWLIPLQIVLALAFDLHLITGSVFQDRPQLVVEKMGLREKPTTPTPTKTTTATPTKTTAATTNSIMGNNRLQPQEDDTNSKKKESNIMVIVHSGASLSGIRMEQRKSCGSLYQSHGIQLLFAVGRPSDPAEHDCPQSRTGGNKPPGRTGTELEQNLSIALLQEQEMYQDLIVTPHRDSYLDMTDKLLGVLRHGVAADVDYIFKMDDEYCLNVDIALGIIREHEARHPNDELYVGCYQMQGIEFGNMRGPHNETSPFMIGAGFGVSRHLAETIVDTDWVHSALYAAYGTSADDANLGKWIDYAMEKHNMTVQTKVSTFLIDWTHSPGTLRSLQDVIIARNGFFTKEKVEKWIKKKIGMAR
jgi:Galactosyltransferase